MKTVPRMPQCKNCGSELPEGAQYCPKCGVPVEKGLKPALAFWGERFVAWLIDIIILGIIVSAIRLSALVAWPGFTWTSGIPSWIPFADFGTSNVVYFLYWMLMEGIYGQSLGKMFMRLRITRLDGRPINMGQAAIESVGKAFLLPIDAIVGWILYPRRRQRLFNYLSQTVVVRA
jgi:uncharacterized RDD family membrane protein YckC